MLNFSWLLSLVIVLACAVGGGYWFGYDHEHKKLVEYQAKVRAAADAQQRVNDTIVAMQTKKTKEIANEYQTRLAAIKSYYTGLRKPAGVCNMPTLPDTASGIDGGRTDDLPGQCAETTLQLMELQRWVRDVSN